MKKIGIVMGSDSDLPIVEKAIATVQEYGVECEVHVYSAHRTPEQAKEFACSAREKGFGVLIAAAGKAAHLAGAIAASTTLPVIGLPIKSSTLDGIDALLSTVQMPSGIPVATVAIDGAVNARFAFPADSGSGGRFPCPKVRGSTSDSSRERTCQGCGDIKKISLNSG